MPEITHFVAGLGTSGTLMGVGRYLKEHKPDVQIWAIEPPSGEMVDGLRSLDDGYIPPIFTDNHGARAARPQGRRAAQGVHRVDAAHDRGRTLRRHLVGRDHGGRGQVRAT